MHGWNFGIPDRFVYVVKMHPEGCSEVSAVYRGFPNPRTLEPVWCGYEIAVENSWELL